jgi:hypothetical protein
MPDTPKPNKGNTLATLLDQHAERTERAAPAPKATPAKERLPGKRSRTDYKQFSVLLKRQTHKQAVRALDDLDNGQDFSDLMEQLLTEWITSHKTIS